jgi:hypothetical protein
MKWLVMSALLALALAATLAVSSSGHRTGHRSAPIRAVRSPHGVGDIRRAAASATPSTILAVEPSHLGNEFAPGAVGLSLETAILATENLKADRKPLVALMRLLGPAVLRIGGNSLDYSWWTAGNESPPAWATSVITPTDLTRLRELLEAANWHVILGVDFGHFEPTRAANEAGVAASILGTRLTGIEIGNEPNGYTTPSINLRASTYNASDYLEQLAVYSAAIHATDPAAVIYGPDLTAPTPWLNAVVSDAQAQFAVLTEHYYPTMYSVQGDGCKGTAVPTALDLLSPQVRQEENTMLEALVAAGQMRHVPTRISETNTTASCDSSGGPDTGPVFASALWSLDWTLRAASAGVEGINYHGTFGTCSPFSFSPLCSPNGRNRYTQIFPHPEYYGLLAARQLEGGRFVPVKIFGEPDATANLSGYATRHSNGVVTVAVDNFAPQGSSSLLLKIPGYQKASYERLIAPSVGATMGVTFGRVSFDTNGKLRPRRTVLHKKGGYFRLNVAPASAVVLTLFK